MICSGCGDKISFNAETCPHCHRDTNSDRQAIVLSFIVLGIGLFAGLFLTNIFLGAGGGVALAFAVLTAHRYLQRKGKQERGRRSASRHSS
jgi:glutaredoxin